MIGRIGGQYGLDAMNRKKSRPSIAYNGYQDNASDEAKFSAFAVSLSKVTAELKNIPDVREDVVADFKTQIDNGEYVPPLDKLANSLILAGLLDTTEE